MKKKILSISAIFGTGILMSLILNYKVEKNHSKHLFNFDNIEALARGEAPDGDHVVCRCSRMTSGSCAANNMSNVCGGGENYDCSLRNTSCN